ncbi:MAG: 30S ribosomal protein S20 [Tissierellia bacterium]|nr:30S ribosomal protein S20 [Tissierellia bacterium]
MANIKSAIKRIDITKKRTAINRAKKSQIKTFIKRFENALADSNFDDAALELRKVDKKLKQAASKNIIHKNAAARKVSRLQQRLNAAMKNN